MDMVEGRDELSLPMQGDCLIHYFKCLSMVEPLFIAFSSDSDPMVFYWYDAFDNSVSSQGNSIQLEKASVLFNLGAICSQIGANFDRTTPLGRHLAMDAFNDAAKFYLKLLEDWITHLHLKVKFFHEEARQRQSSIVPISELKTFELFHVPPLESLLRGICLRTNQWIPKQQRIFLDLVLSEHSPFRITHGGILVAKPWDMPPPYPTNLAILSSSSHMLAIPLKKSEPVGPL
ncbi:hypothetical protein PIB30_056079 [Stylosanthes scabra]|uniref:BRO1 domain-containing protein n=1 Tax=Stylosanthes scabra TaxID=79078 RepID=A0ABU6RJJ6_9FABA|nr:hypothetical protein [Stylosanthes scabra]